MGVHRVLHYMSTNVGMTGVETFMLQLTSAQKRLGLSPMLHCEFAGREELIEHAAERGIRSFDTAVLPAAANLPPKKLRMAVRRVQAVRTAAEVLRREQVDVLHVHSVGIAGLHGYLAAGALRTPVVVTHHTTHSFAPPKGMLGRLTFALEKLQARRVVVPYAAAARELEVAGVASERLRVVPFCVDETRFELATTALTAGGEFRLVMVSRAVAGKGHGELLEAVASIRGRLPALRLSIIGDGPELPAVAAQVEQLGLKDIVELAGRVPHAAVPGILQRSQAIVLPSYMTGETFPLSLLEGMALGLPAIGTRWFGIPDIIADGETGFVVPPRNAPALAQAIERLVGDPRFYRSASEKAVERVRRHFTSRAVAEEYSTLYEEALAG